MDKHYGFIYLTIDLKNGKGYVGQHKISNQETLDPKYIGSGVIISNIKKKYGLKRFNRQILCFCESLEELNEKEIYYINYFNAIESENFYNIASGGHNGNAFAGKTLEEMREISEKISKKFKGIILNKESRKKICVSEGRKVYCKELDMFFFSARLAIRYCRNVLNIKIGNISKVCNGSRNYSGIYNGTKLTWKWLDEFNEEELRKYLYFISDENNIKLFDSFFENIVFEEENKREKALVPGNSKKCYCKELNLYFDSCSHADRYLKNILNIKSSGVANDCRHKSNYNGKYNGQKLHWYFDFDVDEETLKNAIYINEAKYNELLSQNVNVCNK